MMLKDDYRKLFDSISPDAALEQRTRKEIMDMLHPKRKYRNNVRRAVCLVAAMLLLVGTAFAVMTTSGILDRLFRNGEPSQQALESIVRDSMQVSENGVTLNMDEFPPSVKMTYSILLPTTTVTPALRTKPSRKKVLAACMALTDPAMWAMVFSFI